MPMLKGPIVVIHHYLPSAGDKADAVDAGRSLELTDQTAKPIRECRIQWEMLS